MTASSVRYASWYAPWSWGKSSSLGDASSLTADHVPIAEFSHGPISDIAQKHVETAQPAEPAVTTATPELAPAGIDKAAVVDGTSLPAETATDSAATATDPKTLDELFGLDPVKDAPLPQAEIDPTALIDHAGQLKELGLDYGFGMTTVMEKLMETIYLQTGWGWAGSIIAASVIIRGGTFVLQAMSSDKMAAMTALKPITQPIQEKMEAAMARGDKQQADLYRMQQAEVIKPYVGGMAATGGFMVAQGYIGFCAFRILRAMGDLPVPGMTHDGFLWFKDLTVPDPYYVLPAATSAIMYIVFKTGGETGVQGDLGQAAMRQKMFTGFSLFLGLITAFQVSGLQLYFLMSGLLGGITGALLRQNGFRRLVGIRPIPSKEATEVYSEVLQGKKKLSDIKAPDGRIKYQAPKQIKASSRPANRRQLSGINIAPGASIPLHLRVDAPKIDKTRPDRDVDFEEGTVGKPVKEKLDFYRRNYRLSFMWRRFTNSLEGLQKSMGYGGPKVSAAEAKRKQKVEEYERERKRRFENRQ